MNECMNECIHERKKGVRLVMTTCLRKAPVFNDGVLVPIPQYPLYSATCTLLDGALVPYYLDEASGWGLDVAELKKRKWVS